MRISRMNFEGLGSLNGVGFDDLKQIVVMAGLGSGIILRNLAAGRISLGRDATPHPARPAASL
jgi:hypothetical protein